MSNELISTRRRFLALHLHELGTDRIRRAAPAIPRDRPLCTWATQGPRRLLMAADTAAVSAGLRVGQALADAQAIAPGLLLEPDDPAADARVLAGAALWARRYTPLVALEGADGVVLDITGCAHFYGDERGLMADALARLLRAGFGVRGAVAGVAACAAALARAGGGVVLAAEQERQAVAALPIAVALRLDGEMLAGLEQLGLKRVGNVMALPRGPLARRFGTGLLARLDTLVGNRPEALRPLVPPPELDAIREMAEPLVTRGGIELALEGLLEGLCTRLREAGRGVRRLALLAWRVDGDVQEVAIGTGQGVRSVAHLRLLFRDRLEGLAPGLGFERLALEVRESEPMTDGVQAALPIGWWRDPAAAAALGRMLDRIRQRMRVRRMEARASHWPEAMVAEGHGAGTAWPGWEAGAPMRMGRPVAIGVVAAVPDGPPALVRWPGEAERVVRLAGPRRLEGRWWRGEDGRRDFYRVELVSGTRLWLCREADWSLRGRFA